MPIIRVEMFAGRTDEQKRNMVRELSRAFVETAGGNPEAVHIVISDIARSDWASGGQLHSDKFPDKSPDRPK